MRLCAGVGVALLLGSYLGGLHPLGDSLAVFRLWIAVAVGALGLILAAARDPAWAGYFLALAVVTGFTPISARFAGQGAEVPAAGYALYQKNLLFLARDTPAVLDDIAEVSPDFVTLQEVSIANEAAIFARLPEEYDRALCPFSGVGGVAVASRYPFVANSVLCVEGLGMVAVQVATPEGLVWLVSIHLHWPWPHGQAAQVDQILPLIARMEGPVLIGGDFNMVRWSRLMGRFEAASGARMVQQGRPTFRLTLWDMVQPGFEIDHILLPGGGSARAERREFLGSDHRGLVVRFAP